MGSLFSAQAQPSTQNRFSDLPQPLQNLATSQANFLTGQTGYSPAYPYSISAPLSGNQQLGVGVGNALLPSQLSTAGPSSGYINQALGSAYGDPSQTPGMQAILNAMRQQQEQVNSQIRSQYGNMGLANSTPLATALAQSGTQFAGQEGQVLQNAYNTALQNATNVLGYGTALPQQAYQNALQSGGLQQQTQNAQLQAAYNEWQRQQQALYQPIQAAQGIVRRAYTPTPVTYQPSLFSQLLQGAAGAAGMFPGLFGI